MKLKVVLAISCMIAFNAPMHAFGPQTKKIGQAALVAAVVVYTMFVRSLLGNIEAGF